MSIKKMFKFVLIVGTGSVMCAGSDCKLSSLNRGDETTLWNLSNEMDEFMNAHPQLVRIRLGLCHHTNRMIRPDNVFHERHDFRNRNLYNSARPYADV